MILPQALIQTLKKGDLSFADFMQCALYAPDYGYYQSTLPKIGPQGDFITAPELTPLFGRTLAQECIPVLRTLKDPDILEFGAGSGQLAIDLLLALEKQNCLPHRYFILELSQHLRAVQQSKIEKTIPHLLPRFEWLERWPETSLSGIFLANEVLDAMPVHRFLQTEQGIFESRIRLKTDNALEETFTPCTNIRLLNAIEKAIPRIYSPYCSEINLFIEGWLLEAAHCLKKGLMLIVDYGFPRHEYYHPERNQGTLLCHYQHKVHTNPLINIGLQDITAHVDFTEVAEAAQKAGFDVAGYTNQASFLLNNGLLDLMNGLTEEKERIKANQAVKQLIQPQEMGELFKVIALTKGDYFDLNGFKLFDKRSTL